MDNVTIAPFKIIGISVRTTNEDNRAAKDIPELWGKFMAENVLDTIPNKIDNTVYALYTEYESDYTKPYTTILGCKVEHLDTVPESLTGRTFDGGQYVNFTAKGDLSKGVVIEQWMKIWDMDLQRRYTVDFEVYGANAQNPADAEVSILIAVT